MANCHVSTNLKSELRIHIAVLSCHDGDTCDVKTSDGLLAKARLIGIDAPEMPTKGRPGQPYAEESRKRTEELLKETALYAYQIGLDRYNRMLLVFHSKDKENINLKLIKEGYAECYKGSTNYNIKPYCEAEVEAKKMKLGIWKQENYISPSEYRSKE